MENKVINIEMRNSGETSDSVKPGVSSVYPTEMINYE